jgi:hypothetical protein
MRIRIPIDSAVHFGPLLSENEQNLIPEDGEEVDSLSWNPEFGPPATNQESAGQVLLAVGLCLSDSK